MLPSDLKQFGQSSPMPPALVDLCLALVALVAVLTVYALVADTPERQIVVTTRASFDQQIAAERIKAAQEMAEAVTPGACGWRDLYDAKRQPKKRGAM